jgi:hypothetical protein
MKFMKTPIQVPDASLALWGAIGMFASVNAATIPFPTGDFETGTRGTWAQVGPVSFDYPLTEGNPNGFGRMTSTGGQWGIWVGNNDAFINISDYGLVAGKAYTFSQDMKIFGTGSRIGGFKLDWFPDGGSTQDMYVSKIGDGTAWNTYNFPVTIPPGKTAFKIVPLWGPNTSVGFDNIRVNNTPTTIVPIIQNGDFEGTGGDKWTSQQSGGHVISFPATGGNPGGCAVINSVGQTGFAQLNALNLTGTGPNIPLAQLGLTAGRTYTFQQDMKILSGTNIGGLKVEFVPTGTGDLFPAKIGDGTQWATYSYQINIPVGCTQIQVYQMWGANSEVAFDNLKILLPPPPTATIKSGTAVAWTAGSAVNSYQPQESPTGLAGSFTNLGPAIVGNTVTAAFDPVPSPFYQVLETTPNLFTNAVANPGFETADFSATPADNWNTLVAVNGGTVTTPGSYTGGILPNGGAKMLKLESVTPSTGPVPAPDVNVRSDDFNVTGGTSYTYSFYAAHPVKIGGANPQFYYEFLNEFSAPIGITFESFASIGSAWTKVEKTFTAPAGATKMRVGWIQAVGAGNGWQWVTLIDDVSLPTPSVAGTTTIIPAAPAPGLEVSWPTKTGSSYQVESSTNLTAWDNFGSPMAGTGNILSVADLIGPGSKFYRVQETP